MSHAQSKRTLEPWGVAVAASSRRRQLGQWSAAYSSSPRLAPAPRGPPRRRVASCDGSHHRLRGGWRRVQRRRWRRVTRLASQRGCAPASRERERVRAEGGRGCGAEARTATRSLSEGGGMGAWRE
eukprot:scaffold1878_cov113-Isochrysis_galbana.AAC.9